MLLRIFVWVSLHIHVLISLGKFLEMEMSTKSKFIEPENKSSEWLWLEVGVVLTVNRHEKFSKVIEMFQN